MGTLAEAQGASSATPMVSPPDYNASTSNAGNTIVADGQDYPFPPLQNSEMFTPLPPGTVSSPSDYGSPHSHRHTDGSRSSSRSTHSHSHEGDHHFHSGKNKYCCAVPIKSLRKTSAPVDCPTCGVRAMTKLENVVGGTTHMAAAGLCLLFVGPIAYVIPGFKNIEHQCGHCGIVLALWHRSGKGRTEDLTVRRNA